MPQTTEAFERWRKLVQTENQREPQEKRTDMVNPDYVSKRRILTPLFKFNVAMESEKAGRVTPELLAKYDLQYQQVWAWKDKLAKEGPEIFIDGRGEANYEKRLKEQQELITTMRIELDKHQSHVCARQLPPPKPPRKTMKQIFKGLIHKLGQRLMKV